MSVRLNGDINPATPGIITNTMLANSGININGTLMSLGGSYSITAAGVSGLGTASTKDIPATGDASTTQVVYGTDSRLTNSRTPNAHASSHASGGSDALSLNASQITAGALSVPYGGTGATSLTAGNALIGNGTGAVTTTLVATDGSAAAIVKSGTAGLITAGSGGLAIKGSASGTSTITAFSTGGGTQILPPQAGTLVSTGMVNANAQVTYNMLSPAPSSTGGNSTLLVTDSSGNLSLAGTVTNTGTFSNITGTIALGTNASAITANGVTISATELSYIDGVTSNLQTQLNAKAPKASPTFTGVVSLPDYTTLRYPALVGIVDASTATIQAPTIDSATITASGISSSTILASSTISGSSINGAVINAASTIGGVSGTSLAADRTAWTAYTPVISGTGWSSGASIPVGQYKQIGKTVYFKGYWQITSSSSTAGSGALTISLPVTALDTNWTGTGRATLAGLGVSSSVFGLTIVPNSTTTFQPTTLVVNTSSPSYVLHRTLTTTQYTLTVNDVIYFSGTYEAA